MYIIPWGERILARMVCGLCLHLWVDPIKQSTVDRFQMRGFFLILFKEVAGIVSVGINRN